MHGQRLLVIVGTLGALGAISLPAQEAARTPPPHSRPARSAANRAAGAPAHVFARIQGSAVSAANAGLPKASVRLRDARYGRVVRSLQTDENGFFAFAAVDPGSYVVELLDDRQHILTASQLLSLNAADIANVVVREPLDVKSLAREAGHAEIYGQAVTSAAAASGILATRPPKDDVSPR